MFRYLISTQKGIIPHIVCFENWLNHDLCIYLDDFFYKGSYYFDNGTLPLAKFLNTTQNLIVHRKNKKHLQTPRGRLKITDNEYKHFIDIAKPNDHNNELVRDTNTLSEFIEYLKIGKIPTTSFVHNLIDKGLMIFYDLGALNIKKEKNCDDLCCKKYAKGYLEHLWNEKEICAKTIIALHNYYQINKVVSDINDNANLIETIYITEEE